MPSSDLSLRRLACSSSGRTAILCGVAIAVAVTAPPALAGGLVGSDAVYRGSAGSSAGTAQSFVQKTRAAGTLTRLSVYLSRKTTASEVELGLYANARMRPGRRLASCTVRDPDAARWNSCAIAPVAAKQTRYWTVILQPEGASGTLGYRRVRGGGAVSYSSARSSLEDLPATFRTGARGSASPISMYADSATLSSLDSAPST